MWRWLSNKPSFLHFDDVFAANREQLTQGLFRAVEALRRPNQLVFLVCHFGETHEQLQLELDRRAIPYELIDQPIERDAFLSWQATGPASVFLTLSSMLAPWDQTRPVERRQSPQVAVMVAERHPHPQVRQQIVRWCRHQPVPVELGYYMALTDDVIQRAIAPRMIELLDLMGLEQNELVSSLMLSRRLDRVLNRNRHLPLEPRFAENARAWWDQAESLDQRDR